MSQRTKALFVTSLILNALGVLYLFQVQGGRDYVVAKLRPPQHAGDPVDDKPTDLRSIRITDDMVSGLPGYRSTGRFVRLPGDVVANLRPRLQEISQEPSGGRIRFETDASSILLTASSPNPATPHHMTSIMKNGVDLYVNKLYWGSAWPDASGVIQRQFEFETGELFNRITLHLPLYEQIHIQSIKVPKEANVRPATDLADRAPMVFYGSSITQGGVASNPGLSYAAILSRALNVDFVNLGFDGNGLGDLEIAEFIATLDASLIVLDFWANPSPEVFERTLPPFAETIRRRHKTTPLLVIGPFYNVNRTQEHHQKRTIAQRFVEAQRQAGDENIHFFDGRRMLSRDTAFGLADGRHPNSLGFWFCATALEPTLRELLGLPPAS